MYLVYESLYGGLLNECDNIDIIGLYDTKEKALEKAKEIIKEELESNNCYVLDTERDDIERDNYVRFFYNNQENWQCYYELFIKKLEVK